MKVNKQKNKIKYYLLEFETLAKTDVSKMKSNKKRFDDNNPEIKEKLSGNIYYPKNTGQVNPIKKNLPNAEKNTMNLKNENKEFQNNNLVNSENKNSVYKIIFFNSYKLGF